MFQSSRGVKWPPLPLPVGAHDVKRSVDSTTWPCNCTGAGVTPWPKFWILVLHQEVFRPIVCAASSKLDRMHGHLRAVRKQHGIISIILVREFRGADCGAHDTCTASRELELAQRQVGLSKKCFYFSLYATVIRFGSLVLLSDSVLQWLFSVM